MCVDVDLLWWISLIYHYIYFSFLSCMFFTLFFLSDIYKFIPSLITEILYVSTYVYNELFEQAMESHHHENTSTFVCSAYIYMCVMCARWFRWLYDSWMLDGFIIPFIMSYNISHFCFHRHGRHKKNFHSKFVLLGGNSKLIIFIAVRNKQQQQQEDK